MIIPCFDCKNMDHKIQYFVDKIQYFPYCKITKEYCFPYYNICENFESLIGENDYVSLDKRI